MKTALIVAFSLGLTGVALAHEGHDKIPGEVRAPHGGVVQGTNSLYWELVKESGGLKLFPLTHELAPIPLDQITLSGTATLPKQKKGDIVKFTASGDYFGAQVDAKGAYRYTLDLVSTYKGKKEKAKFQVEPQN